MKGDAVTHEYVVDFETTVYKYQTKTEVWAVGITEVGSDTSLVLHSMNEFFQWMFSLGFNLNLKFHNLKFDGAFILYHILTELQNRKYPFKLAYTKEKGWLKLKEWPTYAYSYLISAMGQWYQIKIKNRQQIITITDSLKLLPFSVRAIGNAFKTEHRKLEMEYEGVRFPGCEITEEEQRYIENDVHVVREALEIMYEQGHTKMTIGSCCMAEFKRLFGTKREFDEWFPNVYEQKLDREIYGTGDVGHYCRKAYKGGWCYYVPGKQGKILKNGCTADVNSLYPSVMHSSSGNRYPVGSGHPFVGDVPDIAKGESKYYFITVRTRFRLKPGKLPCIQIKNNKLYSATKWLDSSDYEYKGNRYSQVQNADGTITEVIPTLTFSCTDWEMVKEHYELYDTEVLHGVWFFSEIGMFDKYIDKYAKLKKMSKGALRSLAKLFLNNLYGKFATSEDSSYKLVSIGKKGGLSFTTVREEDKTPGYIPVGAAVTSYARKFTITAAQLNYHGDDKPGFCYADTDSIHCDMPESELVGVPTDPVEFNHWKIESWWDQAIFVRQKTYIEHITHADGVKLENPEWDVKCAGMPENCKELFVRSLNGEGYDPAKHPGDKKLTEEQIAFVNTKRDLSDFKVGLQIYGKLYPKQIPGGVLLVPDYYTMR